MKVLLVYTNQNRYLTPPPVGLTYLIPPLKEQGHTVRLLDMMFRENALAEMEKVMDDFKPDLVGFSIRNLDNQYMLDVKTALPDIQQWVVLARNKGATTVLGGTAFTTLPGDMLKYMQADYGICGQGESSLPRLVEAIQAHTSVTDIPGLVYRDGANVIVKPAVINGYTCGGAQSDWSLVEMRQYKKHALLTPPAAVVVKTGCPYQCSFCDAKATVGQRFIFRDHDAIVDEIKVIQKLHGVNRFFLVDTCFNSPLAHAKQLLERIIREKLSIRFVTRLDPVHASFDAELFRLFSRAGGYSAMVGFHSFSPKMLESYRAPFDLGDIETFGRLANQAGVRFGAELLFGGPGETHATIQESMEFLPRINYSFIPYAIGVRISPHSALFDLAIQEGLIETASDLLFSKFYVSKDIDVAWAKRYIDGALRRYAFRYAKMAPRLLQGLIERSLASV